jgi:hypothetical protein
MSSSDYFSLKTDQILFRELSFLKLNIYFLWLLLILKQQTMEEIHDAVNLKYHTAAITQNTNLYFS